MRCPHDETMLQMTERHGIEIDYCPNCRGVWLDRGELDKIIDQASGRAGTPPPGATPHQQPPPGTVYPPSGYARSYGSPGSPDSPRRYGEGRYGDPRYGDPRQQRRKRKDSFLGDLFDF